MLLAVIAGCGGAGDDPVDTGGTVSDTTSEAVDGAALYQMACAGCHGEDGRGGSGGPDLLDRAADLSVSEIVDVILLGAGFMNPIPLTEGEAAAVAHHVVDEVVGAAGSGG